MVIRSKKTFGERISEGIGRVSEGVDSYARKRIDSVMDEVELRVGSLQDRVLKKFTYSLLFGASIIFLSLGVFYLLIELLSLSRSASFLIIGAVLFILGIFVKMNDKKK